MFIRSSPSSLRDEQACVGEQLLALGGDAELFDLDVDGRLHLRERAAGLQGLGHGEVLVELAVTMATLLCDFVHF